ncbi:MAG TPA: aldehyde dehydrogenase family protein, partial [Solirubrobacterales bacterium]|nr:aldehyde dehydrogenase family protein [Solirubrobacterales bacterium]
MATEVSHWIDGVSAPGDSGARRSPIFNPATGQQQAEVALADAGTVNTAVTAAATAFEEWGQSSLSKRTQILFEFRRLVAANSRQLAEVISDEHGKTVDDAA